MTDPLAPFLDRPIAHRTLHDLANGRPENSWEGLAAAMALNLPVEVDLQLSRDGVPMVFHDEDLDRLTAETGRVDARDAAELSAIPLVGGQRGIPRFDEFMTHVAGGVPVLVELKDQDGALGPKHSVMEAAVCDILRGYDGAVAVMSFNPHMIARCAELAPDLPRGLVTDPFLTEDWPEVDALRRAQLAEIPDYEEVGACFISHNVKYLEDKAVAGVTRAGGRVFCWTVRCAEQEAEARRIAQNITFEGYIPEGVGT